jgi:hypothetical protein
VLNGSLKKLLLKLLSFVLWGRQKSSIVLRAGFIVTICLGYSSSIARAGFLEPVSRKCRIECNHEKCRRSKSDFYECLNDCKNQSTPLMSICLKAGEEAGFEIPKDLIGHYDSQVGFDVDQMLQEMASENVSKELEMSCVHLQTLTQRYKNSLNTLKKNELHIQNPAIKPFYEDLFKKAELAVAQLAEVTSPDRTSYELAARCRTLLEVLKDIVVKSRQMHASFSSSELPYQHYIDQKRITPIAPETRFKRPLRQAAPEEPFEDSQKKLMSVPLTPASPVIKSQSVPKRRLDPDDPIERRY